MLGIHVCKLRYASDGAFSELFVKRHYGCQFSSRRPACKYHMGAALPRYAEPMLLEYLDSLFAAYWHI